MIKTALAAAEAAGKLIRESFGHELKVTEHFAHDIKIELDKKCQDLIYDIILKAHPDHVCIGEEGDSERKQGPVEWIVDPIDGTMNLAHSIPHFCVSIAARESASQKILLGVIYDPIRHEMFTAEKGGGTFLNGVRQHVSPRDRLEDAVLAVGFAKSQDSIDHCLKLYTLYCNRAKKLRAMGSAALDLAYVACGRMDAYIEQGVNLWDIAAGIILVEEAGGVAEITRKPNGAYHVCAHSGKIEYPLK